MRKRWWRSGPRPEGKATYVPWANDGAVPVAHHDIVSILETVRTRAVSDTLLALLELFQETEIPWNCETKFIVRSDLWNQESFES